MQLELQKVVGDLVDPVTHNEECHYFGSEAEWTRENDSSFSLASERQYI
jgi:hypothetical protein